jgi:pyridoxal phosphate-dependent aminotransferase EpsN
MAPDALGCVGEVLDQNWIANMGPSVDAFERELAEHVGSAGCFATHSGTAALHLALRLADVGPSDRVYCSSLTFVASANPILYQGAVPVFIDAEPETGCMSPLALERALDEDRRNHELPKAIIVVHLYGQCADMKSILALADHHGVPVIEDAAQSLGSTCWGRASGTWGRFGVYSFAGNKIITTSTGGALVANDPALIERARFLGLQARDAAPHYAHSELGYNYRLSNVLAAIGRSQLRVLRRRVAQRRAVFARYRDGLSSLASVHWLHEPAYGHSNRWLSVMLLDDGAALTAGEMIELLGRHGIEARRVFTPLHEQALYADRRFYAHCKPAVSTQLFARGVCLPSSSNLTLADQQRVLDVITEGLHAPTLRAGRPLPAGPAGAALP